jgi:[protein-PII] uridylyltransferase
MKSGGVLEQNFDEVLLASGLDSDACERVKSHCDSIATPSYRREIVPERMLIHLDMVEKLEKTSRAQVRQESFLDFHEITICWWDRSGLFSDITGVLYSEGLNVLGARVFSRSDSIAVDLFHVEVSDQTGVPVEARIENIRKKLEAVTAGDENVEQLIGQWLKTNRYSPLLKRSRPLYGPSVKYDNAVSDTCTVIEVNAGDRTGLLHDQASVLSQLGLDIRAAKISTIASRTRGVFYVLDADGKKIEDKESMSRIEKELIARVKMSTHSDGK